MDTSSTILYNNTKENIFKIFDVQIFDNFLVKNIASFRPEKLLEFDMSTKYNYRPDIVSYEIYGKDLYYPIILFCNNIGSIMHFTHDKIGDKVLYISENDLRNL